MLTTPIRRRRPGFTLVEILVVISIIGLLTALSVGALFRLRGAQTVTNSEGTLNKVHGLMMTRWTAVLEQAKKDVPTSLIDRCGGDRDRAVAVWTQATLKNEFPMTFLEARATINLGGGAVLGPRAIFLKVANDAALAGLSPEEQSAALIYVSITQGGNQGNAAGMDGLAQQVGNTKPDGTGGTVFKDGWGQPIVFLRHASGGEINAPPFARAGQVKVGVMTITVTNMLDPQAKISPWPTPAINGWLNLMTLVPGQSVTNQSYLNTQLSQGLTAAFAPFPPIAYGTNVIPTLISAGANMKLGTYPYSIGDPLGDDNLLSYRLRREGDKGN